MKNIYIVGAPRTGKTTLSKLIKQKYNKYNLISFEAIRNGFIKSQPELNMENRKSKARSNILPEFIFEFIKWNNQITNYPAIIEGDFTSLSKIYNQINKNDILICLGHNLNKLDDITNKIKLKDTKKDYTYNWTKEQIKKHFYNICKEDQNNYEFAIKNNINYFNTFDNRKEIFNNILKYIENEQQTN